MVEETIGRAAKVLTLVVERGVTHAMNITNRRETKPLLAPALVGAKAQEEKNDDS